MGVAEQINPPGQQQFLAAYDDYAAPLWRHAYFRVGNREQAEDLVSETFTRAWDHYRGREVAEIKALLYRILNNLIIDHYRQSRPTTPLEEVSELAIKEKSKADPWEVVRLERLLERLPESYRQVLLWRYVDDLEIKQIAKLLCKNQANVYVIIHRALRSLRQLAEAKQP